MADLQNDLDDRLEKFTIAVRNIPDTEEFPKTMLEIIERRQREDYWNRFLRYFIDPSKPHGFGTVILKQILEIITDRTEDWSYDVHDEVTVEAEVQSSNGTRPDLFVYTEHKWGLCIELKVTSLESHNQTIRYAEKFNPRYANVPSDAMEYVYISKQTHPDSVSSNFVDLTWYDIVSVFDDVLSSIKRQYTERGIAQLRDFRDSIYNEITMSNKKIDGSQREKAALYVDYYNEISEAKDAYDKIHKRENKRWHQLFLEKYKPDSWTESWNCDPGRGGYIYKDGWRLDADGNPVTDQDQADFHLEFQHFLSWKPIFADEQMRFRSYISKDANKAYRNEFKRLCNTEYYNKLIETVDPYGIEHVTGKKTHTNKHYPFDGTQLPESFYETLADAFNEHIEVALILTEIHEQAVDTVLD